MRPSKQLSQGLHLLGYDPSEQQIKQLLHYLDLLLYLNQSINLTAIRDLHEAIDLHILDSLTLRPWLTQIGSESQILDVGSGAGLPGIPIAIMYPNAHVTLLDARNKKMNACQHFITSLELNNVTTVHARIESWQPIQNKPIDLVVTRALSHCETILTWLNHLSYHKLLIMKGKRPEDELVNIKRKSEMTRVYIPNRNDERHILTFSKNL
ncbi:MAG: 16S rRNA (guanine(527)-N(7))-methyltransferase RsmG [Pseudomonadota bacterium]|nr:16S rRNA (guanine(527)-N(7))-methyltransferase RsmG [Pseudomonadota bacterium]